MNESKWWSRPAPYLEVWEAMRRFTEARDSQTQDEIWLVEHTSVYTLGQAGRPEHILNSGDIPVVKSDRGGQVTYHGPGQVVAYCLVDLRRLGIFAKEYVALLENVAIGVLGQLGVSGARLKPGAPGVYVPLKDNQLAKIAALGIKIRNGYAYHGLALNVDMDLAPFAGINPCGYEGLQTIDVLGCGVATDVVTAGNLLGAHLAQAFSDYHQAVTARHQPVIIGDEQ